MMIRIIMMMTVIMVITMMMIMMMNIAYLLLSIAIDGSIYNIEPSSVKIRRRIPLANISHVSTSLLNDNFFIIHVPTEYDYVYVSCRKTEVVSILRQAYHDAMGEELTLKLENE